MKGLYISSNNSNFGNICLQNRAGQEVTVTILLIRQITAIAVLPLRRVDEDLVQIDVLVLLQNVQDVIHIQVSGPDPVKKIQEIKPKTITF